ncbi:MAG: acyltransferase family protein [Terracidiphilus sp.]
MSSSTVLSAKQATKVTVRIPSLDGIRAISILIVIAGHSSDSLNAPRFLDYFGHIGNYGVRCFFVISGYLITTLLLKEWEKTGGISLRGFYARRMLRIFPAAFTYIGIIAVCHWFHLLHLKHWDLLNALTYTINYRVNPAHWFRHLWSLSVEEQFYLLWPCLLWLAGRRIAERVALASVFIAPIVRLAMVAYFHASDSALTKHFEAVADTLAIGCLLAMYYNRLGEMAWYKRFQSSWIFWIVALGSMLGGNLLFVIKPVLFYVIGQSLANLGTVLCIDWAIRNSDKGIAILLNSRPMVYIGLISYSLYLYQNAFLNPDWDSWYSKLPQNYLFIVLAALLSYYCVEGPFQRLKKRFG